MSHASPSEKINAEIPVELVRAWMYLILAMIHAFLDVETSSSYLSTASLLVHSGMKAMLKSLGPKSLLDSSSVLPREVLSMIGLGLLGDVTGDHPSIIDTYSEYLKYLVGCCRMFHSAGGTLTWPLRVRPQK